MAKSGPKPKDIDLVKVEALARIGCPDKDIAMVMGVTWEWFSKLKNHSSMRHEIVHALEKGRANGRSSLRRAQWELALKGNATMLIWLGKNELGQSDIPHPHAFSSDELSLRGDLKVSWEPVTMALLRGSAESSTSSFSPSKPSSSQPSPATESAESEGMSPS